MQVRYARRDAAERREVLRTAPAGSESLFLAAVSARCAEVPETREGDATGKALGADLRRKGSSASFGSGEWAGGGEDKGFVHDVVKAWREKTLAELVARGASAELLSQVRGASSRGKAGSDAGHVCSGETCTYHAVRDVYICEATGRVHVCGAKCAREMVRRRAKGHACSGVCHISGRALPSSAFVDTHDEEEGGIEPHEVDEPSGPRATHYHSFSFGYFARDEQELASLGALA